MTDAHPIVTVQISQHILAQGPIVAEVPPRMPPGYIPCDMHGYVAVWIGDTQIAVGRPVKRYQS